MQQMTAISPDGGVIHISPYQIQYYLDKGWIIGDDHAKRINNPEKYIPGPNDAPNTVIIDDINSPVIGEEE